MESPQEFTARANALLAEARRISISIADNHGPLERYMAEAKSQRMSLG